MNIKSCKPSFLTTTDESMSYPLASAWSCLSAFLWLALLSMVMGNAKADQPSHGNLSIQTLTAYNFIVDSNVGSPSTYGPGAATIGAKFCNTGSSPLENVVAYIGNYGTGRGNGTGNTPGSYPVRDSDASDADSYPADTQLTGSSLFNYIKNTGEYAFKHQGGKAGNADATRYIGTIAAGKCVTEYWLMSYPRCLNPTGGTQNDPPYSSEPPCGANNNVTGGIKPEDDLWLEYDIWATANESGTLRTAWDQRKATMRNEISAMANKIWPNTTSKVPNEYLNAIEETLGWRVGAGAVDSPYPGQTTITKGIWYDLGNIEHGFDNDGDLVPDQNAWLQPVGDPTLVDAGCFRLVRTYGLVIIKLINGTEKLIPFVDQLYFDNLPKNNGGVGLIYYEYMAVGGGCSASLTPYQEVASGYDNEKFNGDYGTSGGTLSSKTATATIDKKVNGADQNTTALGGTLTYTATFTNTNTESVSLGRPDLGMPVVISDTIPSGTKFVYNSATTTTLPKDSSNNTIAVSILYSYDGGITWTSTAPTNQTQANGVTNLQWWLSSPLGTSASRAGTVQFQVTVNADWNKLNVSNTAYVSLGGVNPIAQDSVLSLLTGNNSLGDTVWLDNGAGTGGIQGDGIQNGTEATMSGVKVSLYYDANNNGSFESGTDYLYSSTTTTSGTTNYLFSSLPDGKYIIELDKSTVTSGYANTTLNTTETKDYVYLFADLDSAKASSTAISNLTRDFGFAPALTVTKTVNGGVTTVNQNQNVTYTLRTKNNLLGSTGVTVGGNCQYTTWPTANGARAAASNKSYTDTVTKAYQPTKHYGPTEPNNAFVQGAFSGVDFELHSQGYTLGPDATGTITQVEALYRLYTSSTVSDDYVATQAWLGATSGNAATMATNPTTPLTPAVLNTVTGVNNLKTISWVVPRPGGGSWTLADIANLELVAINTKVGQGDKNTVYIDSIGLRVTVSGTCPTFGNSHTNLDPVPVVDTYNAYYLQFVSASPAPDNNAAVITGSGATQVGTLTWSNIGPISSGAAADISVTFKALSPDTVAVSNVNNTVTVNNAKFSDGRSANTGTDSKTVNIQLTGSVNGFIWSDVGNNGWNGTTGYVTGTDGFIPRVQVDLYACVDIILGTLITPTNATNTA